MLRLALVGKDKTSRVWVGNYLRDRYYFEHKRLSEPVERFVRHTHFYLGRGKGKVYAWERKLEIYDFMYKMEPEIWVRYMDFRLEKQLKDCVVSDVRYANELEYLRDKLGFTIIRVHAEGKKLVNIAKILGKEYAPGTLALAELYGRDFTTTIRADYTMTWHTSRRDDARQSIDEILAQITQNVDKP